LPKEIAEAGERILTTGSAFGVKPADIILGSNLTNLINFCVHCCKMVL